MFLQRSGEDRGCLTFSAALEEPAPDTLEHFRFKCLHIRMKRRSLSIRLA